MKLLDRYLLRQFSKNLLLVLSSLLAIYLLVDFFERVDNFFDAHKPVVLVLKYLAFKIPLIFEQLMPVCVLLAGIITLGLLNRNFEFMALKAGGISVVRIVAPVLVGALLFTIFTLASGQWLVPVSVSVTNKIWYQDVRSKIPKGIQRNNRIFFKGEKGIYSFGRPDPKKNNFTRFSYIAWDDEYHSSFVLSAETAAWREGEWSFKNGQFKRRQNDGGYNVEIFEQTGFDLKETPSDFFISTYHMDEKSLSTLFSEARFEKDQSFSEARWKFHQRLSHIFLGMPLILLGIPVLFMVHQRRGSNLVLAISLSCGLAFAAWGAWSTAQSLARAEYLHPALASWVVHLFCGILGFLLILRQDRGKS